MEYTAEFKKGGYRLRSEFLDGTLYVETYNGRPDIESY